MVNTFPNDKFQTTNLKEFANDNFKLDENGTEFSKRVENTMGKVETAISPFPSVFFKDLYCM